MNDIKQIVMAIAATGLVAGLLTVFFDWRGRLRSQIRGEWEARQPVLVVPPASSKVADSMTDFKNVVVAVDFGAGSRAAVEKALSMANGASRVTVVHAIRGVPFGRSLRYPYHPVEPESQRRLARAAWRRIANIIPPHASASRVHARVVVGEPSAEISRVAAEVNADVILVGVKARGVIRRLIMGSTAARVIRASGRPVLAIPQPAAQPADLVQDEAQLAFGM